MPGMWPGRLRPEWIKYFDSHTEVERISARAKNPAPSISQPHPYSEFQAQLPAFLFYQTNPTSDNHPAG